MSYVHAGGQSLWGRPGLEILVKREDFLTSGYILLMQTAAYIVFIYAVLVGLGGFAGYRAAKSLPSLIAGTLSSLLLLVAAYGMRTGQQWGLPLAVALTLFLLIFFSLRYMRSSPRAFMPGGLMAILSLLTLAGIALARK